MRTIINNKTYAYVKNKTVPTLVFPPQSRVVPETFVPKVTKFELIALGVVLVVAIGVLLWG